MTTPPRLRLGVFSDRSGGAPGELSRFPEGDFGGKRASEQDSVSVVGGIQCQLLDGLQVLDDGCLQDAALFSRERALSGLKGSVAERKYVFGNKSHARLGDLKQVQAVLNVGQSLLTATNHCL
ncbi:MAG: hypothetical protein VKO21_11915 [Candidatus Sericytochromatia bacterium]|nr:hypothetical protein [Candidatus Sericytochromatia bacterium]